MMPQWRGPRCDNWLPVIVALAAVPLVAGCGASASPTPPAKQSISAATTTSTATTATTPTTAPAPGQHLTAVAPSAGKHLQFDLTTYDGWHYSGILPFPREVVAFSKDIASSAPRYAKLNAAISGDVVPSVTFMDDNVGRPNGPPLKIDVGYLAFSFPAALDHLPTGGSYGGPNSFGPCTISGNGTYQRYREQSH